MQASVPSSLPLGNAAAAAAAASGQREMPKKGKNKRERERREGGRTAGCLTTV